jgi:replication initiation protein RepC
MGVLPAAISILCLIQRGDQIQKPAAYLRKLAMLAENGLYSLKSLVRKAQRHRFAAVN